MLDEVVPFGIKTGLEEVSVLIDGGQDENSTLKIISSSMHQVRTKNRGTRQTICFWSKKTIIAGLQIFF